MEISFCLNGFYGGDVLFEELLFYDVNKQSHP